MRKSLTSTELSAAFGPSPVRLQCATTAAEYLMMAAQLARAPIAVMSWHCDDRVHPIAAIGLNPFEALALAERGAAGIADQDEAHIVDCFDDHDFLAQLSIADDYPSAILICAPIATPSGEILGALNLLCAEGTPGKEVMDSLSVLARGIAANTDCTPPPSATGKPAVLSDAGSVPATKLFASIEVSKAAIVGMTLNGTITHWNEGAEIIFGYSRNEILGDSVYRLVPKSRQFEENQTLSTVAKGESIAPYESIRLTRTRRSLHVLISAAPITDHSGNVVGASKFIHDITPLIRRERESQRLSRLFNTLSQINALVLSAANREQLLHDACRILTQDGALALAWIGLIDPATQRLNPVAASGQQVAYVNSIHVYADDRPEGNGPSGLAFRSGKTQTCNDLLNEPTARPWLEQMRKARLRAGTAIPIKKDGCTYGSLAIYARHAGYFGATEIAVFEDVARAIGIGLASFRQAEETRLANLVLERERKLTESLIESSPGIVCLFDRQLRCLRWNQNMCVATGYTDDELRNMNSLEFFSADDRARVLAMIEVSFADGSDHVEASLIDKHGAPHPYLLSARRAQFDHVDCLVGIGIDISNRIQAESARQQTENLYRRLFESSSLGIAIVDASGVFLDSNLTLNQLLGYPAGGLTGKYVSTAVAPRDRHRVEPVITQILAGNPDHGEWDMLHRDGHSIPFSANSTQVDGKIMVLLEDISARKAQQQKVARLERLRTMIGGIHSAMLRRSDRSHLLTDACRLAVAQGDFTLAAIVELDPASNNSHVFCIQQRDVGNNQTEADARFSITACNQLILQALRTGKSVLDNNPIHLRTATATDSPWSAPRIRSVAAIPLWLGGRTLYAMVLLSPDPDIFGAEEVDVLEWMASDLSFALDQLVASQQLQHLTYYDPLTGLFNAQGVREQIARFIEVARERGQHLCVCAIDLDDFAQFNERFGREGGDHLLRCIGERLQALSSETFIAGRIGGDTFALVHLSAESDYAASFDRHLSDAFGKPFELDGHQIPVLVHTGVADYPDTDGSYDDPVELDHAVRALKAAKIWGDQIVRYSRVNDTFLTRSKSPESQLRDAIERDEFLLYYQPRVDIISGEIVGAEALVRWQHPEHGLLPPADFIALAERSGLISPLGARVIHMACKQQSAWRAAGLRIVPVAANVSGAQLSRDNLIRVVREALDDNRLEPEWLGLELTESAAMQDVTRAIKSLEKLRELGIKLSLDDFGTGYSSLSYLKRIPIHSVKIDRSFITDITRSVEDATIALAVIAIARSLGLTSVAEGVETFAQLNYLAQNHCDEMQGYLFSAPLNSETFATLLRERPRLDRRQSAASNGRSLLIVDDELSIGKALTRLLRRDGYHILMAGSGEQALEMLAMHRVQVIISDQRMPGMSGTELLDKVKILYPDTIRMVLSGYTDLNVITESVNRGAVFRFLTKPWDDDNLRAQVRDAFLHHDGQNSTP